jgi:predicted ribosome quality control (RQC) complex YloA/Tae2 family protein
LICFYHQIEDSIKKIKQELPWPVHIQKIYSSSRFISLQVYAKGKAHHILFGRGHGFEGIWLHHQMIPSEIRQKDKFLEFLRKNLTSMWLSDIQLHQNDRRVDLIFKRSGQDEILSLFWKGRELYFSLQKDEGLWTSWVGQSLVEPEKCWQSLGLGQTPLLELNTKKVLTASELIDQEIFDHKNQKPNINQKKISTKIKKIEEDIKKFEKIDELKKIISNQKPEDYQAAKSYLYKDLKYKFKTLGLYKKREELFEWLKRLSQAKNIQEERLLKTKKELEKKPIKTLNYLTIIKPVWNTQKVQEKVTPIKTENDYKIHSFENFKIGVGLSAQGNDALRKLWASEDDIWVHGANGASAHAIIKTNEFSINMLKYAADFIAKQSGYKGSDLSIIYTQVKNVKGVTKKPGMVIYKKEKNLLCQLNEEA